MIDCELRPGSSILGGPWSDEREVSGVFGSEWDEAPADFS